MRHSFGWAKPATTSSCLMGTQTVSNAYHASASPIACSRAPVITDAVATAVHEVIADWCARGVSAAEVGAKCLRSSDERHPPAKDILNQLRGTMRRHVNSLRPSRGVHTALHSNWGKDLWSRAADQSKVRAANGERDRQTGHAFHDRRDLAPEPEQMSDMIKTAFTGDARVENTQDADILACVEPGAAIGLTMGVGARAKELTDAWLQSLKYHTVPHSKSGLKFEYISFDAFECKKHAKQANQMLANVSPWHDGVGGLGVSILLRVLQFGPPPFEMGVSPSSWKLLRTPTLSVNAWSRRLKNAFDLAGVHRQSDDFLLYIGRHHGSRAARHAGISSDGADKRRNHKNGSRDFYESMAIDDLLWVANNDGDAPWMPAHQDPKHHPLADSVLVLLFPALFSALAALRTRMTEVKKLSASARTATWTVERLNDRQSFLNALLFVCRVALVDLVARPRHWVHWSIEPKGISMWRMGPRNRVISSLFADRTDAAEAMEKLALAVWDREQGEISSRQMAPHQAVTTTLVDCLEKMEQRNVERHETLFAEQLKWYHHARAKMEGVPCIASPIKPPHPPPPRVAALLAHASGVEVAQTVVHGHAIRLEEDKPTLKRKAEAQRDVVHFTMHPSLRAALAYAREHLVPLERAHGVKWRKVDGGQSRHKQWCKYKDLAAYVGLHAQATGACLDAALSALDARMTACKSKTEFMNTLRDETARQHTELAKAAASDRVLGLL